MEIGKLRSIASASSNTHTRGLRKGRQSSQRENKEEDMLVEEIEEAAASSNR